MPHLFFLNTVDGLDDTREDITSLFFPDSTLEYRPMAPKHDHGPLVHVNYTLVTSYYLGGKIGYHEIGKDPNWEYFDHLGTVGPQHGIISAFGYIWLIGGNLITKV